MGKFISTTALANCLALFSRADYIHIFHDPTIPFLDTDMTDILNKFTKNIDSFIIVINKNHLIFFPSQKE